MTRPIKRPTAKPPAAKQRSGLASGVPHEDVYAMYRALGPARSLRRLVEAVKLRWPANPVALGTLSSWAAKDDWKRRIEEYERGLSDGQGGGGAISPPVPSGGELIVDDVAVLEQAASQALASALRATSVAVRSPSDVKALVDTANKALELAERLKTQRTGVATSEEIAAFGAKLLDRVDIARRKDFIAMAKTAAEAACAEAGTTNLVAVLKKTAASLGMRVDDEGKFYDLENEETSDDAVLPDTHQSSHPGDNVADCGDDGFDGICGDMVDASDTTTDGEVDIREENTRVEVETYELDINDVLNKLRGD
jgi:hypothetical protein